MNKWIKESIKIANSRRYLDRLHQVYPVTTEARRKIPLKIKTEIKKAYNTQDKLALLRLLLTLDKFPIKDPYIAFLRKNKVFLDYNPKTVERVVERLLSMEFEEIIEGVEEPKEFNRQIGTLFKKWLPTIGYPFLGEEEFKKSKGISFLYKSESGLMEFANKSLGCRLAKGPDLLAKIERRFILGEAKFLTDYGGHQDTQFADALRLLNGKSGMAVRIAILDGVVWIKRNVKMHRAVCQLRKPVLTALLLKKFLKSFK